MCKGCKRRFARRVEFGIPAHAPRCAKAVLTHGVYCLKREADATDALFKAFVMIVVSEIGMYHLFTASSRNESRHAMPKSTGQILLEVGKSSY